MARTKKPTTTVEIKADVVGEESWVKDKLVPTLEEKVEQTYFGLKERLEKEEALNKPVLAWFIHPESDCAFIGIVGVVTSETKGPLGITITDHVLELGDAVECTVKECRDLLVANGWKRRDTRDIDISCDVPKGMTPTGRAVDNSPPPLQELPKKSRRGVKPGEAPARYSGAEWPRGGFVRIVEGLEDTCPARQQQFEPPHGAWWVCSALCIDCPKQRSQQCPHWEAFKKHTGEVVKLDEVLFTEREKRGDS